MDHEDVKVVISEDRMAAFIRLSQDTGITMQDLRDALAREGVTTGISPAALREALTGRRGIFYQVASGRRAQVPDGVQPDAPTVICKFPQSQDRPPETLETGPGFRQAWKRLRDRGAVSAGDLLAFVRNADRHPRAVTVTGEEVARIEFGSRFSPGRNTAVSRDGTSVVASAPGIPYQDSDGLGVLDHVEILGDIDSTTGDLAFPGDLSIRGNIQPGFRVSATGSVLVSGSVWGSVTARRVVAVSGGVNAPGEVVESGGGISCRFCENSVMRSAGGIAILEAVVHSIVETERDVEATGEKGRIVGGLTRAALGVKVRVAGSPMGVPTVIEVGVSPRLRREQARMQRELENVRSELDVARRAGRRTAGTGAGYDDVRLYRMRKLLEDREAALEERLRSYDETLKKLPQGYFRAERVLPGVRLVMGTDVTEFTSSVDRISMGAMPRETN